MIAVALDSAVLPLAVAGRGPAAPAPIPVLADRRRARIAAVSDQHDQDHERAAAGSLRRFLPGPADLAELRAIWIVGLPDDEAAALATRARMARVLVNVEDRPALCDFHSVAEVRRGDLLLTVSTGGASPGLAARIGLGWRRNMGLSGQSAFGCCARAVRAGDRTETMSSP